MTQLYENIRKLRKQRHMSQEELAKRTGYTDRSSIARIEAGEIDMPQSKIQLFANVFNVTPQQLMGYAKTEAPIVQDLDVRAIPVISSLEFDGRFTTETYHYGTITIPSSMLPTKTGEYFAQFVADNSMEGFGINEGDLLIYKKTQQIGNGSIGYFRLDDMALPCRKYSNIDDYIYLWSSDENTPPYHIKVGDEGFHVIGVKVLQITK